jgi:hypothetical protein
MLQSASSIAWAVAVLYPNAIHAMTALVVCSGTMVDNLAYDYINVWTYNGWERQEKFLLFTWRPHIHFPQRPVFAAQLNRDGSPSSVRLGNYVPPPDRCAVWH